MQTLTNWYHANSESLLQEIHRVRKWHLLNCIPRIFGAGEIEFFSSCDRKSTYIS